jgi:hypothetical protein
LIVLATSLGAGSTSVSAATFFGPSHSLQNDATRVVSHQADACLIKRIVSPCTPSDKSGSDSSDKITASTSDAVSHASAISICSTTVAIFIELVNVGLQTDPPIYNFPDQTRHHRVLFESIIAPNAP